MLNKNCYDIMDQSHGRKSKNDTTHDQVRTR